MKNKLLELGTNKAEYERTHTLYPLKFSFERVLSPHVHNMLRFIKIEKHRHDYSGMFAVLTC